jgi:hypothetical protein
MKISDRQYGKGTLNCDFLKVLNYKQATVIHVYNLNTWKAEAGGSQPALYSETLHQNKPKKILTFITLQDMCEYSCCL